jgi:hypothetical protein
MTAISNPPSSAWNSGRFKKRRNKKAYGPPRLSSFGNLADEFFSIKLKPTFFTNLYNEVLIPDILPFQIIFLK